jgi:Leucine-rich repeat (LRR) protein
VCTQSCCVIIHCICGCGVDCNELAALPDSIQHLPKLHTLDLEGLYDLSSLPPSIGTLTALECLRIVDCNEDLYSSISVLSCLTDLRLDGFGNELPVCMRTWKLCRLHLNDSQLTRLPVWFSELTTLQVLTLSWARLRKVPSLIGKLVGLDRQVGGVGGAGARGLFRPHHLSATVGFQKVVPLDESYIDV